MLELRFAVNVSQLKLLLDKCSALYYNCTINVEQKRGGDNMTKTKTKKTNRQWYFYAEQGAYFKLDNGVLLMCTSIKENGEPEKDDISIISEEEWYENEPMTRDQMIQDLEEKE